MQHLIVGSSREEDLAGVQLEKSAAHGPNVQFLVVRQTEDWEWTGRGEILY
jgi:hypothetical protein